MIVGFRGRYRDYTPVRLYEEAQSSWSVARGPVQRLTRYRESPRATERQAVAHRGARGQASVRGLPAPTDA
jgi:hypothetical protein